MQLQVLALAVLAITTVCSATAVVREDVEGIRRVQQRDDSKLDPFFDSNPQYDFSYKIHDAVTGDAKDHVEERHGGVVQGSYSLVEPDGTLRHVKYTADDENGFNAVVTLTPGHSPPIPTPLRSLNHKQGVIHHYVDAPVMPVQVPQSVQTTQEANRRVHVEQHGPVVQHHHVVHQVPVTAHAVHPELPQKDGSIPQATVIHHHGVSQLPVVQQGHGVQQHTPVLHPVPLVHNIPLVYHLQHNVGLHKKQEDAVVKLNVVEKGEGIQEKSIQLDNTPSQDAVQQNAIQQEGGVISQLGVVHQVVQQHDDVLPQRGPAHNEIMVQEAQQTGAGDHEGHLPSSGLLLPQVIEVRHTIQPVQPAGPGHQQRSIDDEEHPNHYLQQHFLYRTSSGGNFIKFHSPYASYEII